jgi:hypothetical protein
MNLVLRILEGELSILQLKPAEGIPSWLQFPATPLVSLTQTADEVSIICPSRAVPAGVKTEAGWRAMRVEGKLEFSLVGVLAAIVTPLAAAGISIFSISTFDTDYVLVRSEALERAKVALSAHFQVLEPQ